MSKNKFITIKDVPSLNQPHCKIKDPVKVENILNSFIVGGHKRIQVVSDFDYTITKQRMHNGKAVLTSFGIFNSCKSLPKEYIQQNNELCKKYRPLEIDPKIPLEEKINYMIEWWTKSGNLLVGFPFNTSEIDEITANFKDSLRDRASEFFAYLYKLNVPCLVFSAGLGNSVVSVLTQTNVLYSNVKVVSNFLRYKDGLLNGLEEPMIHTFNKNETVLKGTDYYDVVHDRDHIIVMGDSLGDAGMAEGMPVSSIVFKIGFLFHHIEENLQRYMDTFDIVLIDDQTMDVPLALITLIDNK